MKRHILSLVSCLAGLALAGLAGYSFLTTRDGPALCTEESEGEFDAGTCPSGEEVEVILRLRNVTGHPVRVLGLTFC